MSKVFITGDVDADRKMANMVNKLRNKIIRQATRESLRPALRAAKAIQWPVVTGALQQHTRTHTKLRALKKSRKSIGSKVSVTQNDHASLNQGDVFYLGFLEFGWDHRSGKHIDGKWYVREAGLSVKDEVQTIFRQELHRRIEQEAKSL